MSPDNQSSYERIADALARRSAQARAPADFDRRLWAALDAPPRRTRRVLVAVAAAMAAAVLLGLWLWPSRDGRHGVGDALAVMVRTGDRPPVRSANAAPGDILEIRGRNGDAAHVELRLYRDDALVMACTTEPPCTRTADATLARFVLETRGVYDIAMVRAAEPAPAPTGDLDRDIGAAIEAGADVTMSRVRVR